MLFERRKYISSLSYTEKVLKVLPYIPCQVGGPVYFSSLYPERLLLMCPSFRQLLFCVLICLKLVFCHPFPLFILFHYLKSVYFAILFLFLIN